MNASANSPWCEFDYRDVKISPSTLLTTLEGFKARNPQMSDEALNAFLDFNVAIFAAGGKEISWLLEIDYTNWRGERAARCVEVIGLWYGLTQWHPEPGWLLKARDFDPGSRVRGEEGVPIKNFAVKDIHGWLALVPSARPASG